MDRRRWMYGAAMAALVVAAPAADYLVGRAPGGGGCGGSEGSFENDVVDIEVDGEVRPDQLSVNPSILHLAPGAQAEVAVRVTTDGAASDAFDIEAELDPGVTVERGPLDAAEIALTVRVSRDAAPGVRTVVLRHRSAPAAVRRLQIVVTAP